MKSNEKKIFVKSILSVCFVFIISCQYFGDPIVGAESIVRDKNGKSISEVVLLLESSGNKVPSKNITKEDGKFRTFMLGAKPEETKLTFSKDAYKPYILNFEKEGIKEINIILELE